ncbi:InlB B-repeat-containing protein [Bifidobacterium sp. wkB344]|uniref:RCC1 domain-containing protein n=1 Tax=Bifidobacterium sp. wkB344 TaxID=2025113 RepID=UPI001604B40C|nr:InlB B-repeat-containing protein [Bifidobacterium sp. wkB344]
MKTGTLAAPPQQNPQRPGFRFDGWTYNGQPFDLRTPILQDTTLTAQWPKTTDWVLSPDHGPASGARLTISPPDRQEPYYTSIHSAGDQIAGLTGDGRIYTWTKDSTPMQVPFPAQASDGFHYLQATAGSREQAALGSDQHIYTWNSLEATPTILATSRNTQFTSINLNGDRLLAVDRQGQVHVFQTSQKGRRNPKPYGQETISLPGKAQAVLAVASSSRALIVDADGQAWTWDTSKTGNAKPASVKQNPEIRIVQAQALSQGFLLLDADGQPRYLAGSTAIPATVGLPDGAQASRITTSNDQAVITDADGHIWAWKPGKTPIRADDGSRPYVQAVSAGGKITAISRQGDLYGWSLDGQGQPGKPARLDTMQAPILESASLDGQALTLTRSNGSWQADMPARQPGQAAILITGRQDGKPFTRSLRYTIGQPLARAAEPGSAFTARFDTGGGNPIPADQTVPAPYGRVKRPSPDPVREGFLFDGWFIGEVAYDFSRPVGKDLTLTAHWTPTSRNSRWSISPNKGSQLGNETTTITPPDSASRGIRFNQISGGRNYDYGFSLAVGSDGNAYAWGRNSSGQLGDGTITERHTPVMVPKPAGAPADFTYLQVSAGQDHSLAVGSDGNAYAWGNNKYGQLGDGTGSSQKTPVKVGKPAGAPADFTYVQVSAGQYHSLAVGSDGNAYAWGRNDKGQLGDGTTSSQNTPVRVKTPDRKTYPDLPADFTYLQISGGDYHSLALGSDGNAYAWGYNGSGRLGDGTTSSQNTPVRVKTPDRKTYPDLPADFTYLQISGGDYHSLALGSDGNAYAWGYNGSGRLGDGTTSSQNTPVRVKTPDRKTYPDLPADFTYLQISGGDYHSLALGSDGNAYAWGYNGSGRLGDGTTSSQNTPVRVKTPDRKTYPDLPADFTYLQISGGDYHSLALGSDGNAYAWGYNGSGRLGDGTTSSQNTPVRVKTPDRKTYPDLPADFTYLQISGGDYHSLALGSDGNAYAWGYNGSGRLGDGTTSSQNTPVRVKTPDRKTYPDLPADFTYLQISGGDYHSLALGSDGNAYAWGYNGSGRLGDGTTSSQNTPVRVKTPDRKTYPDLPADFTYLQISGGDYHSLALGSDGNAYAWGYNGSGRLGDGTTSSQNTPVRVKTPDRKTYPDLPADFTYLQISGGDYHSLALGSDGNAYAWGYNGSGRLGDGTTSSQNTPVRVKTPDRKTYPDLPADFTYLQISGGDYHSLALGSDGNAYAWGYNGSGRLGDGTTSSQNTPVRVKTPDRKTYPDLPADFTYLQISAGGDHSLAVGSDGYAYAWGCNYYGNLGNNTASGRSDTNPVPVRVRDPSNPTDKSKGLKATQVSGGVHDSLAVGSDGYAWAWGFNNYGQLGNNSSGSSSSVPVRVRDPSNPTDKSQGLQAVQVSGGNYYSLAVGSDGNAWAWGYNSAGQLGDNSTNSKSVPVPVSFNLQLVITGVRFDQTPASGLTRGDGSSVSVLTPAHQPGTVTVSVDYTLGGAGSTLTDKSLTYTYLPAGVLPKAGGEGILLALATGMTGMGGILASRRHRQETRQLVHASHE